MGRVKKAFKVFTPDQGFDAWYLVSGVEKHVDGYGFSFVDGDENSSAWDDTCFYTEESARDYIFALGREHVTIKHTHSIPSKTGSAQNRTYTAIELWLFAEAYEQAKRGCVDLDAKRDAIQAQIDELESELNNLYDQRADICKSFEEKCNKLGVALRGLQ